MTALLGFFSSALHGAPPKLTATMEPSEMRPGSYASYVITIEGGRPDAEPALELPEGVEMASSAASFQQQTSIINGVVRMTYVLGWQVTSSQPGEHVIPAQEMHVNGIPFKTNEVKLVVKEDASSEASQMDPQLMIETTKREFYVGEVVPITANLYVHMNTRPRRVGLIEIPKDNFAIQRFPTQAEQSEIRIGGTPYIALAFQSSLSGMKPGKFKLGPATSEIILDVPLREGRFMNPLFGQSEQRKLNPQSNEIDVTVLPLPTEGRPKDFKGVVGDFEISMTADPKAMSVGDPISVEITITGNGNFDALTAPELTSASQWKTYPARRFNVGSSNNATVGEQSATFSQVIIPTQPVTAVPSFELSYFSPEKKKYLTLRTPPVPIEVKQAQVPLEPPPATAAAQTSSGAGQTDKVPQAKAKVTDILTVPTAASAEWLSVHPPLWREHGFVVANLAAAGALLLLLGGKLAAVAIRNRAGDPGAAGKVLWQSLNSGTPTRVQFYDMAATYIQMKGLEGAGIQPILTTHDALSYGRGMGEADTPISPEERTEVLKALQN